MQDSDQDGRLAGAATGSGQVADPASYYEPSRRASKARPAAAATWQKSPSLLKFAAVFFTVVTLLSSGIFNGVALQLAMNQLFAGWQAGIAGLEAQLTGRAGESLLAAILPYLLILLTMIINWGGLHLARRHLAPVMLVLVAAPAAWLAWAMYSSASPPELLRREEVIPAILLLLGPYAVRLVWARISRR